MKRLVILSCIGLVMLGGLAWAQEEQEETIQSLNQRVKELEEVVRQLKAAQSADGQRPAPVQQVSMQAEEVEEAAPAAPMPAKEISAPSWPVGGIYTVPDTKDLGAITGFSWLAGTKIRGWIDTDFVYNFNEPDRRITNANQGSSIVKGHHVTIEGRTFDIHDRSFNLALAEVEIEKVSEFGGVGFKFDLAFGETQDIIIDTIKGKVGAPDPGDAVSDFDKTFQHASVSYIAPIGRGLRFDAGKFVTHIGGETIETVKNWNYSHSFFYTYAIPFQDVGVHLSYPWTDTFYTDFYVLNGWNVTFDNNSGKTFGPAIGWIPLPWLSVYTNYLVGPEQADNSSNMRHLWDTQIFLGPFDRWNFLLNYDLGYEESALAGATRDALWTGAAGYVRYKLTDWLEPSLRGEYYNDRDGFTTGLDQELWGVTLTLNTKLGLGKGGSILLLRPEVRYDHSGGARFFTEDSHFRRKRDQVTLGMGVAWFF